jgi:cell division transport system ATP-binding protein
MIEFISVSKEYGSFKALEDINLAINPNEFVFLTGHSGSGKTTLIKMIIREITPSSGNVVVDDIDITKIQRHNIYNLRRKVGVIFQDFRLIEDKNAFENVSFAMEASGRSDKDIREVVPYVLDIVGLSDKMDSFPRQLSGGQKQKVAIARAIANDPKILIADEPTGNLDEEATWDIIEILQKINKWGTTVIMSTHSAQILKSVEERMITIEQGKLVFDTHSERTSSNEDFSNKILESESIKVETKTQKKKKKKLKEIKVKEDTLEEPTNEDRIEEKEEELQETQIEQEQNEPDIKPKIKISLSKKAKNVQPKSISLDDYGIGNSTIELLNKNKYFNMQDILQEGIEKIKLIDDMTGDSIFEIENAIEKFYK